MSDAIVACGVRVHNLKGLDVRIPLESLVVVTGVSGSGKSSLAFDTLFAEGQRRYVESLSVYARQFLERLDKPDVRSFEGLCPAIAIRQRPASRNPRSTVATATEIHDHLRLLFASVGQTLCACGAQVGRDDAHAVSERLQDLPEGTPLLIGFPVAVGGTPLADLLDRQRKLGFGRALLGEQVLRFEDLERARVGAELVVLVDRVQAGPEAGARLAEGAETAFRQGGGLALVQVVGGPLLKFSERFECTHCGRAWEAPRPQLFSFNSPVGACPTCHGFGNLIELDEGLLVPDPSLSLEGGAIEPWRRTRYAAQQEELLRFARRSGISASLPWAALAEEHRRAVLEGDEEFPGVVGFFRWLEGKRYKVEVRVFLSRYRGYRPCPACRGARLRPEALQVRVGGRNLDELSRLSVREARTFLAQLGLDVEARALAGRVLAELDRRLGRLCDVGLEYLTLERPSGTLSGGESQRLALATALGTGLVGTLFVLDEPSVGLHPRDTDRLIKVLEELRDQGNTVLVVEHDASLMRAADHLIELGPGAGEQGGRLVFAGSFAQLLEEGRSLTAKHLRGDLGVPLPARRRRGNGLELRIRGARARNLKRIDVRIPLGALTCVTGVSGSGKSTLVHEVLYAELLRRKGWDDRPVGEHDALMGAEYVEEVVLVDQSPIGRSPRSNPVTYLKAFDPIRDLFAALPEARRRGLGSGHFSFNVPGGRCETCGGDGQLRVDLQFLADVALVCETCRGRRYRPPVLEVRYRGRSIDQVLELTVREGLQVFAGQPKVTRRLKALDQIGLGYLRLGQPASTLSGGEAQRVKLAAHLLRRPGERVLYVLDEPTTGLHAADVAELLACFQRLLDAGATLVVVEHNLDVIKQADWLVDLGPEGGPEGGHLVFQGTPEALAAHGGGFTAGYLRNALAASRVPAGTVAQG